MGAREHAVSGNGPTLELGVVDLNTTIDDIGVRLGTGRGIVDVAIGTRLAVRNSSEAPGGTLLGSQGPLGNLSWLFPEVNLAVLVVALEVDLVVGLDEGNLT
jgi:hypothetical protein